MEVKVIRSRVLEFLKKRDSIKVNSGIRVIMKLIVWGKWVGSIKRQAGARDRDIRSVWLGSNNRQPARIGR